MPPDAEDFGLCSDTIAEMSILQGLAAKINRSVTKCNAAVKGLVTYAGILCRF
jgi:hypothetical protein